MNLPIDFDILLSTAIALILFLVIWDLFTAYKYIRKFFGRPSKSEISIPETKTDNYQVLNQHGLDLGKDSSNWSRNVFSFIFRRKLLIAHLVIPILSIGILYVAWLPAPYIQYSYPGWEGNWDDYSKPIEIVFNQPVDISRLKPFLSREDIQGEWYYEKYLGFMPLTRVAKFYPSVNPPTEKRLVAYITGVGRLWVDEAHEHAVNFYTNTLPEVYKATPLNGSNSIPIESVFKFELNKENASLAEWEFVFDPAVEFEVEIPDDKTFIVTPKSNLVQGQTYNLNLWRIPVSYDRTQETVISREPKQQIHELTVTTVRAPLLRRFFPQGTSVKVDERISLHFETDMDKQSVEQLLRIEPEITAKWEWEGERILHILPIEDLSRDTLYTIYFPAGILSAYGGISEKDSEYTFHTIGPVRVNSYTPSDRSGAISRSSKIAIVFDQEVDHESVQSHFTVSPGLNGSFTWDGNKMTFTPDQSLAFDTTYTITLSQGIKSIYGSDSNQSYSFSFTTVSNTTIIPGFGAFSFDKQDYNFSCGVAAIKMFLTWRGIYVGEDLLISQMGHDTRPFNYATNSWGNPNKAFVGYGNGSGDPNNRSAYGVHWDPIKNMLSNHYGIGSVLYRNWNIYGLAQEISAGHPVQIWWWNGVSNYYGMSGAQRIYWNDLDTGETVEALQGMHSVLVVGFNGDVSNPTSFIVLDPWWGYQTYSIARFNDQWPKLDNTGLVLY